MDPLISSRKLKIKITHLQKINFLLDFLSSAFWSILISGDFKMKNIVLITATLIFSLSTFAADLVIPKKNNRSPSSVPVQITGAKAEALFRATLATDESLIDYCTAHTCSFTTKCSYDQTKSEKYTCTVVP